MPDTSSTSASHPVPRSSPKPWPWTGWLALLAIAAILRCINLDTEPFWLDEINSVLVAMGHGYPETLPTEPLTVQQWLDTFLGWQPFNLNNTLAMLKTNVHLPLYYLLLHPWLTLWGLSELSLRGFAVVWSVVLIIPTLLLANHAPQTDNPKPKFFNRTAYWVTLLLLFTPFQLIFAQEGRMYTLVLFLTALSGLSLWRLTQNLHNTSRILVWWWVYALSTLAGLFSHYIFWFQGIFHGAVWLHHLWNNRHHPKRNAIVWPLLVCVGVFGTALALWWPIFKLQQAAPTLSGGEHFSEGLLAPIRYLTMLIWEPWMVMTGSNIWAKIIYIPLTTIGLLLGLVFGITRLNHRHWNGFMAGWIWLPLLAIIASDVARGTHTSTIIRYGMLMAIPVTLLVGHGLAWGIHALQSKTLTTIITSLLTAIIMVIGIGTVFPAQGPLHYRGKFPAKILGYYAAKHCPAQPNERLIVANGPLAAPLNLAYYMQEQCPQQPLLYYVSPYREHPVPVPRHETLAPYQNVWLFRYRGGNERGLDDLLHAIRLQHPHGDKVGPRQRWVVYQR